jgi:hypothetical protein
MVLLLIAMALLRERSIVDTANELCLLRSGPDDEPVKANTINAARARNQRVRLHSQDTTTHATAAAGRNSRNATALDDPSLTGIGVSRAKGGA